VYKLTVAKKKAVGYKQSVVTLEKAWEEGTVPKTLKVQLPSACYPPWDNVYANKDVYFIKQACAGMQNRPITFKKTLVLIHSFLLQR
jgi:hypothetical protein